LCLQAFAKDAELLLLLKALITKHAFLADTPAAKITAEQIKHAMMMLLPGGCLAALTRTTDARCCPQAFAKDARLLQLLKTLITKHATLADTPAAQMTAEVIQQLQEAVREADVSTPDALWHQVREMMSCPLTERTPGISYQWFDGCDWVSRGTTQLQKCVVLVPCVP
jgi:hypothetical protein